MGSAPQVPEVGHGATDEAKGEGKSEHTEEPVGQGVEAGPPGKQSATCVGPSRQSTWLHLQPRPRHDPKREDRMCRSIDGSRDRSEERVAQR